MWPTFTMRHFIGVVLVMQFVKAQEDICLTNLKYRWTYNAQGASPCVLAGTLISACLNKTTTIQPLDPGERYPGAQKSGEGAACRCSTVYYSILSACGHCQNRAWITWPGQIENCEETFVQTLPVSVPGNTSVIPPWAWADVVSYGAFDIVVAQTLTTTPAPGPTATLSGTSSLPGTSSSTSDTPQATGGGEKHSNHVGPIVGGVIGGIFIVGIVVAVVVWIVLRSRRSEGPPPAVLTSPPMGSAGYSVMTSPSLYPSPAGGSKIQKIYNPNDPSTFPMLMDQSPPPKSSPGTSSLAISTGTPQLNSVAPVSVGHTPQSSPPLPATQAPLKLVPNRRPSHDLHPNREVSPSTVDQSSPLMSTLTGLSSGSISTPPMKLVPNRAPVVP